MHSGDQYRIVTIECKACCRPFVPGAEQIRRELMIVCPHCKAHYVPGIAQGRARKSNSQSARR